MPLQLLILSGASRAGKKLVLIQFMVTQYSCASQRPSFSRKRTRNQAQRGSNIEVSKNFGEAWAHCRFDVAHFFLDRYSPWTVDNKHPSFPRLSLESERRPAVQNPVGPFLGNSQCPPRKGCHPSLFNTNIFSRSRYARSRSNGHRQRREHFSDNLWKYATSYAAPCLIYYRWGWFNCISSPEIFKQHFNKFNRCSRSWRSLMTNHCLLMFEELSWLPC